MAWEFDRERAGERAGEGLADVDRTIGAGFRGLPRHWAARVASPNERGGWPGWGRRPRDGAGDGFRDSTRGERRAVASGDGRRDRDRSRAVPRRRREDSLGGASGGLRARRSAPYCACEGGLIYSRRAPIACARGICVASPTNELLTIASLQHSLRCRSGPCFDRARTRGSIVSLLHAPPPHNSASPIAHPPRRDARPHEVIVRSLPWRRAPRSPLQPVFLQSRLLQSRLLPSRLLPSRLHRRAAASRAAARMERGRNGGGEGSFAAPSCDPGVDARSFFAGSIDAASIDAASIDAESIDAAWIDAASIGRSRSQPGAHRDKRSRRCAVLGLVARHGLCIDANARKPYTAKSRNLNFTGGYRVL